MIVNRIALALRRHDWPAIIVEFVLVSSQTFDELVSTGNLRLFCIGGQFT